MSTIIQSKSGQQIELYRKDEFYLDKTNVLKKSMLVSEKRISLCNELGLEILEKEEQGLDTKLFYHYINDKEMGMWASYLPKQYSKNGKYGIKWANYRYDSIPDEVLEEISFANKTGFFTDLVIRTPEKINIIDPVCFGVSEDDRWFIIARWGESLLPFKTMQRKVFWKEKSPAILGIIILSGFFLAAIISMINQFIKI